MPPIRVLSKDNVRPRRHSLGSEACPRYSIMQPKQNTEKTASSSSTTDCLSLGWGGGVGGGGGGIFASTTDYKYSLCFYYGLWSKCGLTTVDPEPGKAEGRRVGPMTPVPRCGGAMAARPWQENHPASQKTPPLTGPARPAGRWRGLRTHGATKQLLMEFEN